MISHNKFMSRKIIVVDDERDVAETMMEVLHKEGYDVDVALSGEECLNKVKENSLVMLDVMMPGMNGYSVAKLLKEKYQKKINIVFVTIKSKSEVNLENVDGFIQKPFIIQDLVSVAKTFIKSA